MWPQHTDTFDSVRKLIAVFFLLLFTTQHLYAVGYIGWFYANQKAVTSAHCVNKFRPSLKCNGKCFLAKKLKEAEDHQREDRAKAEAPVLQLAPCINENEVPVSYPLIIDTVFLSYTTPAYCYIYTTNLLRPPKNA